MKIYVGVTDMDWFQQLKEENAQEMNFWQPSGNGRFRVLKPNEMFLFKQHERDGGRICGGGFFVKWQQMSWDLAWNAFGSMNGMTSFTAMHERIINYRRTNGGDLNDPCIGCIILTQPFYFDESDYIDAPDDWSRCIVRGKSYDTTEKTGAHLFEEVQKRLGTMKAGPLLPAHPDEQMPPHSVGTGVFRLIVSEAYKHTCAITGEKILPALIASHIKPLAVGGENVVRNGLMLRADIASLFSCGLLTIKAENFHVQVSPRIRCSEEYRRFDNSEISLPESSDDRPDPELLKWHNDNIFIAEDEKK